jgi:hypothetical protein
MWVRLFSRYGVRCLPHATCAYTIHEAAAITGMWLPYGRVHGRHGRARPRAG